MARAAAGEFGDSECEAYGLFPRGLLAIFDAVEEMRKGGAAVVLSGSAVELSIQGNQDMLMRLEDVEALRRQGLSHVPSRWSGAQLGVAMDKNANPPRLTGMTELILDSKADVRELYAALATRNTASTLMNDSSSRSHCFAFLTLRVHDKQADTIRTSRFQFVDLAGSERLKDAHGMDAKWKEGGEAMNGLITNYSLMMLSSCARQLVEAQRKGKASSFSFKSFIVDLVLLLQESMSGEASTACFVCLSQAPDNLMQSKIALDFGEAFARLAPRPRVVKPVKSSGIRTQLLPRLVRLLTLPISLLRQVSLLCQVPRGKLVKDASSMHAEAKAALGSGNGGGKYRMMRIAQLRAGEQELNVLGRFGEMKS